MIDIKDGDSPIAFFIAGAVESWRKSDQGFSVQGQQQLATCHILQAAVWLEPFPLAAKDLGNMLSALTPVLIYRGLNLDNISVGDGLFSDGNGQHIHYISERAQGRH